MVAIDFAIESYADVIGEIKPLLEQHYAEIASFRDHVPLAPDYARYADLEAAGTLVIITARRAGRLVGYSIFFLIYHLHYSTTLFAMNDIIFLLPEERQGGSGVRLIRESERLMRARGARLLSWHIKPVNDFSPVLHRMGYVYHEITMAKVLED